MSEELEQAQEKKTRRVRKPWVDGPLAVYRVGDGLGADAPFMTQAAIGEDFASPDEARAWIEARGAHDTVYECHVRVFRVRTKAQTAVVLEDEGL